MAQERLQSRWDAVGEAYGFSTREAAQLLHRVQPMPVPQQARDEVLAIVRKRLEILVFIQGKDIIRALAVEAPGRSIGLSEIEALRQEVLRYCETVSISKTHGTLYRLADTHHELWQVPSLEQHSISRELDEDIEIEWDTL